MPELRPDGTPLRRGWTTGACATAASKAALGALLGGAFEDTSLPWDTQARMLDNLTVAMAGASAGAVCAGGGWRALNGEWRPITQCLS